MTHSHPRPAPRAMTPTPFHHAQPTTVVHCEVWAGTPATPYTWLLFRREAARPDAAVQHLRAAGLWLADRLDTEERTLLAAPADAVRDWTDNDVALQDLRDQIARGKYIAEALTVHGHDNTLYTLTAMPTAGCPCRPVAEPTLLDLRGTLLVPTARALTGGAA